MKKHPCGGPIGNWRTRAHTHTHTHTHASCDGDGGHNSVTMHLWFAAQQGIGVEGEHLLQCAQGLHAVQRFGCLS